MKGKAQVLKSISKILRLVGLNPGNLPRGQYLLKLLQPIVGDITIEVNGLYLTGSLLHRRELWKLQANMYEPFTVRLFKQTLRPGMVVCDIGAHLGFYSLLAAKIVGSKGKVYAFEPDLRTFPYLVRNIKQNGFSDIVVAIQKAVSDRNGDLILNLDGFNPGDTSLFCRSTSKGKTKVSCIALDDFFPPSSKIDLIKIDIEGGELLALRGMENLLARSENVKMFVECNPLMLDKAGRSVKELITRLTSLGFDVKAIDEETRTLKNADPDWILSKAENSGVPDWAINLYCSRERI